MNYLSSRVSVLLFLVWISCGQGPSTEEQASSNETHNWPSSFGFGRVALASEIDSLNIDVAPDGEGLPPGKGDVLTGRTIYDLHCAVCHGRSGIEGPYNKLVTYHSDTLRNSEKTIGNYWPYATTLYDYINRAMPYNKPGTLTPEEVYSLTAFLLYKNNIIDSAMVLDASNLAKIEMPARKFFVDDDRKGGPEVR